MPFSRLQSHLERWTLRSSITVSETLIVVSISYAGHICMFTLLASSFITACDMVTQQSYYKVVHTFKVCKNLLSSCKQDW
jgi:hypothetical protein